MSSHLVEYVWLDGYTPEPTLRSKVQVIQTPGNDDDGLAAFMGQLTLKEIPDWGFDGSSTEQAEGGASDCLLKPVRLYQSPVGDVDYFVMCEVLNADGTPHTSNTRNKLADAVRILDVDETTWWFGFEQEYFFMKDGRPLGWPKDPDSFPAPQGSYYCGGGITGRILANSHTKSCLYAGISITGNNAEVALGQWEYQCFGEGVLKASDDLWMSRWFLIRLVEEYEMTIDMSPKPLKGAWNGSGMHTNFSNSTMRDLGGKDLFTGICDKLGAHHDRHINMYGSKNEERLTGEYETQAIDTFSYGVSDRGASIRIPIATVNNGWKGYLEDRRPAANADPYKVVFAIIETLVAKST